jgi:hypothetical protein
MTSHREVAKDVFETRYADGSRTVCNYRAEAFSFGGETAPSMGYVLFGQNGAIGNVKSFKSEALSQ